MIWTGNKIYKVQLDRDERKQVKEILDCGKGSKERHRRAHILLMADEDRSIWVNASKNSWTLPFKSLIFYNDESWTFSH